MRRMTSNYSVYMAKWHKEYWRNASPETESIPHVDQNYHENVGFFFSSCFSKGFSNLF